MFALELHEVLLDQLRTSENDGWNETKCLRFLDSLDEHLFEEQNIPLDMYGEKNKYNIPLHISFSQWFHFTKTQTSFYGSWTYYSSTSLWVVIASLAILEGFQASPSQKSRSAKKKIKQKKSKHRTIYNPFEIELDFRHFALLFFIAVSILCDSPHLMQCITQMSKPFNGCSTTTSHGCQSYIIPSKHPYNQPESNFMSSTSRSYDATLRPLASSQKSYGLSTTYQNYPLLSQMELRNPSTPPKRHSSRMSTSCPPFNSSPTHTYAPHSNEQNYLCRVDFVSEKLNIFLRVIHRHYLSDINHVIPSNLEVLSILMKPVALSEEKKRNSYPTLSHMLSGCSSSSSPLGDIWSSSLVQRYLLRNLFCFSKPYDSKRKAQTFLFRWTYIITKEHEKTFIYPPNTSSHQDSFKDSAYSPNTSRSAHYPSLLLNELQNCQVYIFDKLRHLKIQNCSTLRVVAPAVAGLVVISCCSNIEIMTTCHCLRVDNSSRATLYVYSLSQPIFTGQTHHISLGPYNVLFSAQEQFMRDILIWHPRRLLLTWDNPLLPQRMASCEDDSKDQSDAVHHKISQRTSLAVDSNRMIRENQNTMNITQTTGGTDEKEPCQSNDSSYHDAPCSNVYSVISPDLFRTFLLPEQNTLTQVTDTLQCNLLLPRSYAIALRHQQTRVQIYMEKIKKLQQSDDVDQCRRVLTSIKESFVSWLYKCESYQELDNLQRLQYISSMRE